MINWVSRWIAQNKAVIYVDLKYYKKALCFYGKMNIIWHRLHWYLVNKFKERIPPFGHHLRKEPFPSSYLVKFWWWEHSGLLLKMNVFGGQGSVGEDGSLDIKYSPGTTPLVAMALMEMAVSRVWGGEKTTGGFRRKTHKNEMNEKGLSFIRLCNYTLVR